MVIGRSIRVIAYFNFSNNDKFAQIASGPAFSVSKWHRRTGSGELNFCSNRP